MSDREQREQLEKCLKPQWVWAIAFGSAIDWGSFVLPADWIAMAGPMGAILGLGIGAVLMIIIGVSYGFLIKIYPVTGWFFLFLPRLRANSRVLPRVVPDPRLHVDRRAERIGAGIAGEVPVP